MFSITLEHQARRRGNAHLFLGRKRKKVSVSFELRGERKGEKGEERLLDFHEAWRSSGLNGKEEKEKGNPSTSPVAAGWRRGGKKTIRSTVALTPRHHVEKKREKNQKGRVGLKVRLAQKGGGRNRSRDGFI